MVMNMLASLNDIDVNVKANVSEKPIAAIDNAVSFKIKKFLRSII